MGSRRGNRGRRLSLKSTALPAGLALVLGGLAACSSGAGSSAAFTASAACPAQATVTVWANTTSPVISKIEQDAVTGYEQKCPGDTINLQYYTSADVRTKLTAALAAGNPPTMFELEASSTDIAEYADKGQLVDLTAGVTKADPQWKSEILASSTASATIDGKLYAFPYFIPGPIMLFYNKSVFAKAGIAGPPATMAQFTADVAKIKAAGYIPVALGDEDKYPSTYWLQYLTDRIGGTAPFQAVQAGKANAWSNPAIMQALEQLRQLAEAGTFGSGYDSTGTVSGADKALLYTGKAAMTLNGSYALTSIEAADPSFLQDNGLGYAPFPSGSSPTSSAQAVYGVPGEVFAVTSASTKAQQEVAEAFMATEFTTKQYAQSWISVGSVPAVAGVGSLFPDTDQGNVGKFAYQEASATSVTFADNWYISLGAQEATLAANVAAVTDGSMSPAQFVQRMNATLSQ